MTIDISDNDPRISYTANANGAQTAFAVPFEFFDNSDLKVYVAGVLKSEGTGSANYGVSGGAGSTGTVTFVSGVTASATVVITRSITVERVTDFTAGADINRAALNTQLDTLTAIAADLKDSASRSLRLADYDPTTALSALPAVDDRKGKVLNFNATTGNPEVGNFTTISNFTVSNDLTVSGKIALADNVQLNLGASEDFKIYHDGSVTFLTTSGTAANEIRLENNQNTSDVRIRARNIAGDSTVDYVHVDSSHGHVYLFYNGIARMKVDDDEVFFYRDVKANQNIVVSGTVDGRDVATDGSKLDGIEASADVTDATNVTAAGALMDSEVTNLAEVKAFASSDYATAAQGTLATNAMPKSGGAFTGAVTVGADTSGHDVKFFGDTSGEYVQWIASEDTLYFPENSRLMFGGSTNVGDLRLYSNSTNAYVECVQANDLIIKNQQNDKDVIIQTDNSSGGIADYFRADGSTGESILYHYGSEKFATKSTGVDVTGNITVSGTVDGVDIATRDGVLTSTTTTANAALPKAGGTMTGALKTLTLQETYVANSTGATTTLDLSTGTSFSVTLSENTQFAFTLPTLPSDTAFSFTLFVTQPSSAKTIAWPASVDWAGGSAPAAPSNSEVNAYGFYTRDGGTTYYGFLGGVALG